MTIGNVIKKYRKSIGLTQEEMANRLGVTTPAVNKWENNNTQPDVGLLSPIARLLGITPDILLSFHEKLTDDEISDFVMNLDKALETVPYDEVFAHAKQRIEEYPNCEKLAFNTAVILDAWKLSHDVPNPDMYDRHIYIWYANALESKDDAIKNRAATSLCDFFIRKECFDKAEEYLKYFSKDEPAGKRRRASIYGKTGRIREAYGIYEEMLFTGFNQLQTTITDLRILYMHDDNLTMAHKLADIENGIAKLFEMGRYHEVSAELDLAVYEKDREKTAHIMNILIESYDTLMNFTKSELYGHTPKKNITQSFFDKFRQDLIKSFQDEKTYGYMRGNEFWEKNIMVQAANP